MHRYILRRLVRMALVVLCVSLFTFHMVRLSGDPGTTMLPIDATPEQRESFRREMGLNRPLYVQFLLFAGNALRGDLGESVRYRQTVVHLLAQRLPATLELSLAALALAVSGGIILGVLMVVYRRTVIEVFGMSLSVFGISVPGFWLGIMLIIIFSVNLGWLPTSGRGTWRHLILPAVTLGVNFLGPIALLVQSGVSEVMRSDFVRTARAKGLSERTVLYKHSLRNALIPVISMIGVQIGTLMGGAVITESVFQWPGVGLLALQAVSVRDFPLTQGAVLFLAVVIVMVNFAIDLSYALIDPRIRYH